MIFIRAALTFIDVCACWHQRRRFNSSDWSLFFNVSNNNNDNADDDDDRTELDTMYPLRKKIMTTLLTVYVCALHAEAFRWIFACVVVVEGEKIRKWPEKR